MLNLINLHIVQYLDNYKANTLEHISLQENP